MMASGRASLASSGVISGFGLASAKMIGWSAIVATISGLSTPAADSPRNTSAPTIASRRRALVGVLREDGLVLVHQLGATLPDQPGQVGHPDVLARQAELQQQAEAGQRGGAGAGGDELDLPDVLAGDLQRIQQRRADDDGGAVLVVVEDRDLHPLAQLALDVEAVRRLDVLEVDAAEGRLERCDHVDQLVQIVLGHLDVEDVDAGELLEQHALAFHHRLARQRPDVAQAEHGGAVGDHRDQVAARGVAEGIRRVGDDLFARRCHAGRIGECQVALVDELLGGGDRDLARASGTRGIRALRRAARRSSVRRNAWPYLAVGGGAWQAPSTAREAARL